MQLKDTDRFFCATLSILAFHPVNWRQKFYCFFLVMLFSSCLAEKVFAVNHPFIHHQLVFLFSATVREVIDGDTIVLEEGQQVRLVGIQAPKLGLGRPNFMDWPKANDAKDFLVQSTLGKKVQLYVGQQIVDHNRRLLAHVVTEDGKWLQEEMLLHGWGRVYSFPDNRRIVREMLAIEKTARAQHLGIWADDYYAIQSPDKVGPVGSFQIVEGKVLAVAKNKEMVYLNFQENWRTDFTVEIKFASVEWFLSEGIDIMQLQGQTISVRGWVENKNGPMIEVTHPEQIEILPMP